VSTSRRKRYIDKSSGLRKTVLSQDHPSTLTSTSNLAFVLRDQGKPEQVEETFRQALGLSEDLKTKSSMRRELGR
jgi:hypothetical protein